MPFISRLVILFSGMIFLAGCTVTAQQNRNITPLSKADSAVTQVTPAAPLSEIRAQKPSAPLKVAGLKTIYADGVDLEKKLKIHMKADFGREYYICEVVDQCEQVNIAAASDGRDVNSSSETNPDRPAGNAIGEVYLSEQTKKALGRQLSATGKGKKILIMTPDVELSVLTAGGLQEPHALWTAAATNYMTEFTRQYVGALEHQVAIYQDGALDVPTGVAQDLINLHEAVGKSIFTYQYPGMFQLPTKKSGVFDWTLGMTARRVGDAYGADLGLFFFVRDSYSSGSRIAAQILVAALFGASMQGGTQVGFVSLVDMKSGDILWFNRLVSTTGDLRRFEPAFKATDALLQNIPL